MLLGHHPLKRSISFLFFAFLSIQVFANDPIWQSVERATLKSEHPNYLKPVKAQTYQLNVAALKAEFALSPKEKKGKIRNYGKVISLPLPDGSFQKFAFAEYDIMEAGLMSKWDFVKTYTGQGIDDPFATVKVDFTLFGFHYQVKTLSGTYYADPVFHGDSQYYQIYNKTDLDPATKGPFVEYGVDGEHDHDLTQKSSGGSNSVFATGATLRTYRIAIAATGEYTTFHGGASQAASAIVTTLNRVNGLYETDVCVRLILVANNNLLIYTSSTADPYTNNNGGTMLGQNQTNVTTLIGTANYDIGHVFSTGGGGIAGLGVVCDPIRKASGVTGSNSPVGDPFDIDYVAHEVGHQFGGNHTFNSVTGSCGGNNRSANSAYEPGSGTTIMAYAGICGNDNLQANSNAYFHFKSYQDIVTFTNSGGGNSCPVKTQTGNAPPVLPAIQGGFVIPINTNFKITSSQATDADNDVLSYCWEESDLGTGGAPASATGTAPTFRSFSPVPERDRVFPKWSSIRANATVIGEKLAGYARALTFKVTIRDNNAGAGGSTSGSISLSVNATGGAFAVSSPNTNIAWEGGSSQTITWTAGSTASAPFNSPFVRIKMSSDGGVTFPYILADSTQNDGTQLVTMPVIASTTCRVLIESIGNIFFDLSNVNFRLTAPTTASIPMTVSDTAVCAGQNIKVAIDPTGTTYNAGNVFSLQMSNASGQFTIPVVVGTVTATNSDTIAATIPVTASGNGYKFRVISTNPVRTSSQILNAPKINGLPTSAGTITGVQTLCINDSTQYFSITPVSGISGYNWTIPVGSTILSNPDSNAIKIRFGGTAGNISVNLENACGFGPVSNLAISPIVILPASVTASASTATPCLGTSVTFTANPTNGGSTPTYQWLKNDTLILNATNATYSTSSLVTGDKFKVILVSSLTCGDLNSDTSSQVVMTVNNPKTPTAVIESNAQNDTSCAGEAVTFTALLNNGGGTNPQYAWFKNTTAINGQTTQVLTLSNLVSTDSIRLRLSVTGNCLTSNQVFSQAIRLQIMTLAPNAGLDTALCPNGSATFTGIPIGGTWTGTGVTSGGAYSAGASGNSTLTYTVNKYGCTRTDTKVVSVLTLAPVTYTANLNTLTCFASGATSWQWKLNGNPIPDANSSTYVMTESGEYCVEVTFASGCKKTSTCTAQIFTGIDNRVEENQMVVYPNPARTDLQIEWKNNVHSFEIVNMLGQKLDQVDLPASKSSFTYSVRNLPRGMYQIVTFNGNGRRAVQTFIKD
jgi:hypothetical protein